MSGFRFGAFPPPNPASELIADQVKRAALAGELPAGRTAWTCPGCEVWQIDTVDAPDTPMRAVELVMVDHALECPGLASLLVGLGRS